MAEIKFDTRVQRDVWLVVEAINESWVANRASDIGEFLHRDCVMATPDIEHYLRGRDAVVNSYVEYARQAQTLAFDISQVSVDVFRDTAMVNCIFAVKYSLNGVTYSGGGREIWTLIRVEGQWLGIWRTLADLYEERVDD